MHGNFVLRYIGKHMYRALGKSVLSVLLAALLLCAAGQLASMWQSYDTVFRSTVITARFFDLPLDTAIRIADSVYISEAYYESAGTVLLDLDVAEYPNFKSFEFVFTNDIARYTDEECEILYAEGYDESCMDKIGSIIIVEKAYSEVLGLELGSKVTIGHRGIFKETMIPYIEQFTIPEDFELDYNEETGEIYNNDELDVIFIAEYGDQIMRNVLAHAVTCTVAGVFSTPSGQHSMTIFSPGNSSAKTLRMPEIVEIAEYTVLDNYLVDEFRESCERIVGSSVTNVASMVMDTSKIENVRNSIRIIDALYPIVVVASLLMGGFLCSLVILQSAKEAATMRVLGATKAKTRLLMSLEQVLLSLAGLAVGAGIMRASQGTEIAAIAGRLSIFATLYLSTVAAAAVTCAVMATRRSPLELLQTKE